MKMANLLQYIDCNIAGPNYASKKKVLDFPSFVAGYLQEMIQMKEFGNVLKQISEKIKHLSFLGHLMCRYEDFEKVLSEYESVLEDLAVRKIDWDNDKYFREWEMHQTNKISKVCQNNKEEYENIIIDSEDNEMQSFYGDEILEVEKTEDYISNPAQNKILKNEKLATKRKEQNLKKEGGAHKA